MSRRFEYFSWINLLGIRHFKIAKKEIAVIAKDSGLSAGKFDLKDAKSKIDLILRKVEAKLNDYIAQFNLKDALPFLIEETDSLVHIDEMDSFQNRSAMSRDIAFDLTGRMKKQNEDFTSMHRNYRYLIEKFVQLSPTGTKEFNEEEFCGLVALVDWFYVFVMAGDQIHHNLFPTGIEVSSEFLVDVVLPEENKGMTDQFGTYIMNRRVGVGKTAGDSIESPRPINEYLDSVDKVFLEKMGFLFRDLVSVLQVLATWGYRTKDGERTSYSAKMEQIIDVCLKEVKGIERSPIVNVVEFLKLKRENICKVVGKKDYPEIPVWEHYKRHSRYTTKPIIIDGEELIWGPYSAMKSGILWAGAIQEGILPVDLQVPEIKQCLLDEKALVESELEKKACEILKRFTSMAESNVYLHKRDKAAGYPEGLGDYDVLAFLKEGILVNVECKHLQQVFALKDSRDLREELFGKTGLDGSYVGKAVARHDCLEANWQKVLGSLKWPNDKKPKVISIFCSKQPYFWTFSPPIKVPIDFKIIDELHEFIESLRRVKP